MPVYVSGKTENWIQGYVIPLGRVRKRLRSNLVKPFFKDADIFCLKRGNENHHSISSSGEELFRKKESDTGRAFNARLKKRVSKRRIGPEERVDAEQAAQELGVAMATVHHWLRDGILVGEQLTPGAPRRIILTDDIRARLAGNQAPAGWVGMTEAARRLGVSTSHVAYWVKSGKLSAVRVTAGKRQCWKIDVESATCGLQNDFFE